jgi:hypothetical protein
MRQTDQIAEQIKLAKKQRKLDSLERIPIKRKFRQGKNGYLVNYIRARTAKSSDAWIRTIFPVMQLYWLRDHRGFQNDITKFLQQP